MAATNDASIQANINSHEVIFVELNNEDAFVEAMDESVCAVIIEGIQGVAGIHIPDNSFLQLIAQKCIEFDAIFIADEVQSGYGRTGKFFAHQHADVKPDLITVAKGMGNGFPIAGVLIHPKFQAKYGLLGTTFGGNHLACAAAIAVLDVIKDEQLIEKANATGEKWMNELKQIDGIKEVRGKGLMIGLEFEFPISELKNNLTSEHHLLVGTASNKNVIRLLPALTINEKEIELFNKALVKSLENANIFLKS